ncbi:MAG: hypothetical protein AAF353_04930 [Pseudomonadota bacterium]
MNDMYAKDSQENSAIAFDEERNHYLWPQYRWHLRRREYSKARRIRSQIRSELNQQFGDSANAAA